MIINPYSFLSLDPDAQNVIEAIQNTGVTLTPNQIFACNTLINDLKAFELWVKEKALYGVMGGTAAAHKFNWKDPRDLDAAFRLVFSGGWTHSLTGAKPNGTNGFANTFLNCRSVLDRINYHTSFYSRTTDTGGLQVDLSAYDGVAISLLSCDYNLYGGGSVFRAHSPLTEIVIPKASTVATGFFTGSRTTQTMFKAYKNGVQNGISTISESANEPNEGFILGAISGGGYTGQYSNKECAFASIGDGLTDTEVANFYIAVQAFQTTLLRNI